MAGFQYYKLVPTSGAPALEIDGIRMHRTSNITPDQDAKSKIKALHIKFGRVLDTCAGLGYSAIEASKKADFVIAVEIDPKVIEIAKTNSWSAPLFSTDHLHLVVGDVFELIKFFPTGYFNWILHDPPRVSRSGELYGLEFYKQMFRVLKYNSSMFHYIGTPGQRFQGKATVKGVIKRLKKSGFKVRIREDLQGVIATKPRTI